jgi:hypothetical protein
MKKLLYTFVLALILNSAFYIQNSQAQWVQMPNGMGVDKSVAAFGANSGYIFAGLKNVGVYRSADNGLNWTNAGMTNSTVHALATINNIILAGPQDITEVGMGIYRSTNNGDSWTSTNMTNQNVWDIVISGSNIFAGSTYSGVYLSTNNGASWTQTALNNKHVFSLAILGSNIFAGTIDSGIYISSNNGTSWTETSFNHGLWVYSLATIGNNIYAGTDSNGVYLSTNNGTTWTQTALNNQSILSIITMGNNIFAGTDINCVYLSTNNGASWTLKNQGLSSVTKLRRLFISNNYIFAGTKDSSVFRRSYSEIIGITTISTEIPSAFSLGQNYPNPFNPTTKIRFAITKASVGQTFLFVTLSVFDIMGREVATLVNEQLAPGTYETTFDGSALSSGTYFYKLTSGDFSQTKRLTLLK